LLRWTDRPGSCRIRPLERIANPNQTYAQPCYRDCPWNDRKKRTSLDWNDYRESRDRNQPKSKRKKSSRFWYRLLFPSYLSKEVKDGVQVSLECICIIPSTQVTNKALTFAGMALTALLINICFFPRIFNTKERLDSRFYEFCDADLGLPDLWWPLRFLSHPFILTKRMSASDSIPAPIPVLARPPSGYFWLSGQTISNSRLRASGRLRGAVGPHRSEDLRFCPTAGKLCKISTDTVTAVANTGGPR
jgi:hypothetical protein